MLWNQQKVRRQGIDYIGVDKELDGLDADLYEIYQSRLTFSF